MFVSPVIAQFVIDKHGNCLEKLFSQILKETT